MSLLDSASKRLFKPLSPLKTTNGSVGDGPGAASAANADYRLDLTLQNLLSIGSEFSPDDIISLRKRARYGDSRWLYSLYDEMMRLGPAPQVLKAKEAIKGTQSIWHASPDEADEDENSSDPKDKAARLIRDVTEEAWGSFLPDLKSHLSTKFFYGIAAVQIMWRPRAIEGKWSRVTDIRPVPARRFRLDPVTLRFKFLTNPYTWEGPFVDDLQASGKLVFVEVGADVEPLDQRGLLYQCLIPWAIEQYTVRWRAKRLQNFGMPPVMVEYPKADPQNKAVADQLADLLASGTRASVPEGLKASLLAAPGAGSRGGDPYEANIEWCARQYDQIILGHSQVSGVQVGAGSRTSSTDAIGLFKDVTNSRAKELDQDLRQQCFFPYVAREFGTEWAEENTPALESSVIERDDPKVLSEVALNLYNAGAAGAIAVEDLVERATLKVPEDGETTLAGNVKGDQPAPAEVDATNKANPAPPPTQVVVGPDGKPLPPPKGVTPPALAAPAAAAAKAAKAPAPPERQAAAAMGDFAPAARSLLRRRKGKRAIAEFATRRERFSASAEAARHGGRPRITIRTFGHDHGAPADAAMTFDVRSMGGGREYDAARTGRDPDVGAALEAHPMTGAIYGGVKSRLKQAIAAAALVGQPDLCIGVGCEHGKHRSVYVAERLKRELLDEGHDVTVDHRDAETASGERGIGDVVEAAARFHHYEAEAKPVRFTAIEEVERPAAVKHAQARIAARVRARLKEQHARAAAEAEHKLAKAE